MKIYVNEIPTKGENCLFYKHKYLEDSSTSLGFKSFHKCNVNGQTCDLFNGRNCNKLKLLKE